MDLDRFPDELWMAIFEYLDIVILYRCFYNINHHLNSIIHDKRIRLQADLSRIRCEHLSSPFLSRIRSQIVRLTLSNRYFPKQISTFSQVFPQFDRFLTLHSLTLDAINASDLFLISVGLPKLIHLIKFDVTTCQISTTDEIDRTSQILIYASPSVRTLRLHLCHDLSSTLITMDSPLEHLTIRTWCDLKNVYNLLSHTPSLQTLDISLTIQHPLPSNLLNLSSLTVLHLNIWFLNDTIQCIENLLQSMPYLHHLKLDLTVQHRICIEQIQRIILEEILLSQLIELEINICLLNTISIDMNQMELILRQWFEKKKTNHACQTFIFHVYFRYETTTSSVQDMIMIDLK